MKFYCLRNVVIATLVLLATGNHLIADDHATPSIQPGPALAKLKEGNARFVAAAVSSSQPTRARRLETAKSQHPFAIIVGCSDSRTPPEMVFDQNIGDLFVVRAAGQVVADYGLGSIEFAVEHLGARLIVVLGHERCGAVAAAVAGPSAPGHIGDIVRSIRPAAEAVRNQPGDELTNAIKKNVDLITAQIRQKAELGSLASSVKVVGAYYDFDSGKVEWLNP